MIPPGGFVEWQTGHPGSRKKGRVPPGWIRDVNGCDVWQGAKDRGGYGVVTVKRRNHRVHRLRYEREVGPVPKGLDLDHFVCSNRACCRPSHLRPVTRRENALRSDGRTALNAAKTHCPQGHPYTKDNLVMSELRLTGQRKCRTCGNARRRAAKRRQREEKKRAAAA